ncbi:unnamed protein product [Thelazia callipaeda]|uniref:Ubiquitin-like domain-containing protein n=1 Tax=Thelazia callipaeda TaxID=103827 RepID=A0A0N5CKZ5_THECL|nr:unnamed protein product [Thelazia callipaeda]
MADSGSEEEVQKEIHLNVKTTTESYDIAVSDKATISTIKSVLSEKINQPSEKLCLIFSGKILKDHETLTQHSIKDGMAIHLVIRNSKQQVSIQYSAFNNLIYFAFIVLSNNYFSLLHRPLEADQHLKNIIFKQNPTLSGNSMGGLMGGALGMAQQMMQNPDALREMTNSPIIQSLLNSPEIIRSLIADNPQIQQVIEANPELGHLLNDPEIIRQTIEMVRNPTMFQELMRSRDQAIRNLQGIPGGQAALQRLYHDVQEPLLNSASSTFAGNPFATLVDNSNNITSRSQHAGVENAEPLPNPWGNNSSTTNSAPNVGRGLAQLFASSGNSPSGDRNNALLNMDFSTLMNMMQQHPSALPPLDMNALRAYSNPRVIEAFQQIESGMNILRQEAPRILPPGFVPPVTPTTTTASTAASNTVTNGTTGTTTAPSYATPTNEQAMMMLNLIRQMTGTSLAGSTQPPEERYRSQLEQLTSMGFSNQEANIQGNLISQNILQICREASTAIFVLSH